MSTIDQTPSISSIKTPKQSALGGYDRREAVKVWKKQAESEARIGLLNSLVKEGIGLAALEKFQISIEGQFKSQKFKKTK